MYLNENKLNLTKKTYEFFNIIFSKIESLTTIDAIENCFKTTKQPKKVYFFEAIKFFSYLIINFNCVKLKKYFVYLGQARVDYIRSLGK